MAGVLDTVDQRTRLAGHNRLELLLFHLGGRQRFGINVFKVQEVIQCPPLTRAPNAHPVVRGMANMRGRTISVMDLGMAIGRKPVADLRQAYVVITEYNRRVQGFLVSGVDRIVNMNWEEILPPPRGVGSRSYLTAVTKLGDELVEIVDVEQVLAEVAGQSMDISEELAGEADGPPGPRHVLVADDSAVARRQVQRTLEQIGYECTLAKNGAEALEYLERWAAEGPIEERVALVVSDIEMPEMDGYMFTTRVRKDPRLQGLYIILHTSLSGVFNNAMVDKVGADRFIAKFDPDELARGILEALGRESQEQAGEAPGEDRVHAA